MEEIYVNVEGVKPLNSRRSSAKQEGPRRLLRASVLGLGLLSVFLLAGLIGLAVHYHNSVGGAAADLSTVKANLSSVTEERDNLTERLQARDQLINQLKANLTEKTRDQLINQLKANLTEKTRDQLINQLNASLTEKTREVDRLLSLMDKEKTCHEGWRKSGCSCYLLSTEKASWEQSRDNCTARGADLVIVDSYGEQEFITSMINEQTWIGLNDINQEGTWKWVDGTPLTLTYWGSTPDNGGAAIGEEDCASLVDGREIRENWNDLRCTSRLQWICERMA